MKPMKEVGIKDIQGVRSRLRKLWGMGRVGRPDFEYIDERLDEVEARIVEMHETDEYGKEVHR